MIFEMKVQDEKLCLLYRPSDGVIVHYHRAKLFVPGRTLDVGQVEKRALEEATRRGHDVEQLAVLHVAPAEMDRRRRYRVDTSSGTLIVVDSEGPKEPPNLSP